ncbi:hypothetical protein V2J09_010555 [Rumex salicifolius]
MEASGFAKGIWLLWRTSKVSVLPLRLHPQHITVEIKRRGKEPWVLSVIYGSPKASMRLNVWCELEDFALSNNRPWILAGDFNATRATSERSRQSDSTQRASENNPHSRRRPFRFHASWLMHDGFKPFLERSWQPQPDLPSGLTTLSTDLLSWNGENFGNIFKRKRRCYSRIAGVQRYLDSAPPMSLIKLERHLRTEVAGILEQEQTANFLVDRDHNTKFYHLSTVMRRKANNFESLRDGDCNWIDDLAALRSMALTHFARLYTVEHNSFTRATGLGIAAFPHLAQTDIARLKRPISFDEICSSLNSMAPSKSSGPDVYPTLFYQWNWIIVGPVCMDMVSDLLNENIFPKDCVDAFLFPIAKVSSPNCMNHLLPISLLNVNFKLATKVLVNRLKPLMPKLIALTQSSFIPCRQNCDNIVLVQEVLHSMRSRADGKH